MRASSAQQSEECAVTPTTRTIERRQGGRVARSVALAVLGVLAAAGATAQSAAEGWQLRDRGTSTDASSWTLYTQPVAGSSHPRYRLVARSPATVERIAQAIVERASNARHAPADWTVRTLARGDDFIVNHITMDVPVVSDRDVVIESRWKLDREADTFRMEWAPPSGALPAVSDGASRITSRGFWEVSRAEGSASQLVYEQHSEIGDSIPQWLVDRLMDGQIVGEFAAVERILSSEPPDVAAAPPTAARSSEAARPPTAATAANAFAN